MHFVPITIAEDDHSGHRGLDVTACVPANDLPGSADAGRIEVQIGGSRMVVTGRVDPAVAAAMVAALGRAR